MKLFSEKVDSTFTNSSFNVLQVENFSEIFFDVYEIELNKIKYPAEKIGDHEGHPVVSVPVVIGEQECRYPFVLVKGPFNVLFNEKNRILGAQSRKIDSTNVNEELEELIEETSAEDEITYDNLIQEESKVKILEQIREAKQKAAAQINKLKLVAIDEATIDLKVKKQEFDKVLESAKDQLVNEFVYISNNIKNELLDATNSRYEELDDTFSSRIDTLVEELQFDLKSNFKSASKLLDSNIRSLISEIHSAQVIPAISSEISKIAAKVSDKVQKIEEKLDTKLSSKADIALVESINTSVEAIQVANVELNDAINKGVNRALSRVGTVNSKLAETVSVLSEKIDHKINTATEDITEYYTNKIKALEDRTFEINENSRQYFIQLVQESRDNLIQEIRDIKKDAPVEYIVEANNKRTTKSLDSITSELDKKITSKVTDEIARLKQYISMYSSGGGSVAQQFANGGTMNGNLTVAGAISASSYLGLVAPLVDPVRTTLTGNGVLSAYAINGAGDLVNPSALIVAIDGALQEPSVDYTVSGGNITFTSPLPNGSKAVVVSPVNTIQVGQVTPSDGSVTSAKIAGGVTISSPNLLSPSITNGVSIVNGAAATTIVNQSSSNRQQILSDKDLSVFAMMHPDDWYDSSFQGALHWIVNEDFPCGASAYAHTVAGASAVPNAEQFTGISRGYIRAATTAVLGNVAYIAGITGQDYVAYETIFAKIRFADITNMRVFFGFGQTTAIFTTGHRVGMLYDTTISNQFRYDWKQLTGTTTGSGTITNSPTIVANTDYILGYKRLVGNPYVGSTSQQFKVGIWDATGVLIGEQTVTQYTGGGMFAGINCGVWIQNAEGVIKRVYVDWLKASAITSPERFSFLKTW